MLSVSKLDFGFNDAVNYKKPENRALFNKVFIRTNALDKLVDSSTYFLIGEKGTGKTAYAVYLSNSTYKGNTSSSLNYIQETEYQRFLALKRERHLVLSDYTNIWKVIILLLFAERIIQKSAKTSLLGNIGKFQNLEKAINEFYLNAFSPEIINALTFVEQSKLSAELIAKYAKAGGEDVSSLTFSESRFQINLLFIERKFKEALELLKLDENFMIFIDGVDIRPSSVPYDDYLDCAKGLANAVWSLNNEYFPNIKKSKGRMKVVLLIRPDIFDALDLQNKNNKIRDNAVLLDWRTNYGNYASSELFALADNLLRYQQQESLTQRGDAWNYYFPYHAKNTRTGALDDSSFIAFLRFSFYRPRDIVTILRLLQEPYKQNDGHVFKEEDFNDPEFRRQYSDYLLGEIKDHISFYYSNEEYELFLKFFEFLRGVVGFGYKEYLKAYAEMSFYLKNNQKKCPRFFESADTFLQFLYELNIICFKEKTEDDKSFIRWSFRERSNANLFPKIKTGEAYEIHYGLAKALNFGQRIVSRK